MVEIAPLYHLASVIADYHLRQYVHVSLATSGIRFTLCDDRWRTRVSRQRVLAQKIYLEISSLNYGYASALGMVMVGIVALIGVVGLYLFRRVEATY